MSSDVHKQGEFSEGGAPRLLVRDGLFLGTYWTVLDTDDDIRPVDCYFVAEAAGRAVAYEPTLWFRSCRCYWRAFLKDTDDVDNYAYPGHRDAAIFVKQFVRRHWWTIIKKSVGVS